MAVSLSTSCVAVAGTASSGGAATPSSDVQMAPPNPAMRHESNAMSEEYETLRRDCKDHRHAVVLSTGDSPTYAGSYACSYLGEGAMSVLFSATSKRHSGVTFAVKFNKLPTWTPASRSVTSVQPSEIDATCVAWYLLSVRGLSPHVPRVFGVLPFVLHKDMAPYAGAQRLSATHGLVMETLTGFLSASGTRVCTVKTLLREGMAGRVVDAAGHNVFEAVFRVVLFQVLYTVAMWNAATHNGFRHNDLHAMNVCITYWREDHSPVEVEYHLPGADGVDRVFVLRTPYCAAVIDFGYAAVLPGACGGPAFDPRFYYFSERPERLKKQDRSGAVLSEPKFEMWGMSHRQPSPHYDALLFCYAVLHEFNMKRTRSALSVEFRRFYARCFGAIHLSATHMYQSTSCSGRLTPLGQRELLARKPVPHGAKRFVVMEPSEALLDPFFLSFRGAPCTPPRPLVFGFTASAAATSPMLSADAMARTVSTLSANPVDSAWKPRLAPRTGLLQNPLMPGLWVNLTAALDACLASVPRAKAMGPAESAAWSGCSASHPSPVVPNVEESEEAGVWNEATAPGENL